MEAWARQIVCILKQVWIFTQPIEIFTHPRTIGAILSGADADAAHSEKTSRVIAIFSSSNFPTI